jgi:hypothetical protein
MDAAPSLIGPPVHASWLVGKLLKHVRASAQPHSDLLGFPKPPLMSRFLLARVGKSIAVAAGEQAPGTVQLGDAAMESSRVMLKLPKRLLQVERLCSLCGLGKMII